MRYLFVLLLSGCATVWDQPGKSEGDFRRDSYECERDAAVVMQPLASRLMQTRCMESKGWARR